MSEYPQPGLHPDADTLSAFAEGVLPEHERLACLGHFAECAACREVVYLAQEPLPREAVPAADKISWWKQWLKPVPALSAAALAGVLMLSIALYRLEKRTPDAPRAAYLVSDPAPKPTVEAPHPTAAPRAARKTLPNVPRSVSVRALSRPEALLAPLPAVPQRELDSQPAIAGTITDPTGAPIPGAAVIVRRASGAPGVNAITDNSGQFLIAGLQPGQYELQVTRPGFQASTKKVEIQPGQLVRADSSLSVGSVAETVEVTASAAAINTQTASLTTPRTGFAVLPLPGRVADSVSLPSKLAAVATASKGKVILAADSAGTLFRSDNAGKKWNAVKAVWQGKVVELAAEGAAFRLTTDTGTAWLSPDGAHWDSAPPPER